MSERQLKLTVCRFLINTGKLFLFKMDAQGMKDYLYESSMDEVFDPTVYDRQFPSNHYVSSSGLSIIDFSSSDSDLLFGPFARSSSIRASRLDSLIRIEAAI